MRCKVILTLRVRLLTWRSRRRRMFLVPLYGIVGRLRHVSLGRVGTEEYASVSACVVRLVGVGIVPVLKHQRPYRFRYSRRGSEGH